MYLWHVIYTCFVFCFPFKPNYVTYFKTVILFGPDYRRNKSKKVARKDSNKIQNCCKMKLKCYFFSHNRNITKWTWIWTYLMVIWCVCCGKIRLRWTINLIHDIQAAHGEDSCYITYKNLLAEWEDASFERKRWLCVHRQKMKLRIESSWSALSSFYVPYSVFTHESDSL